MVKAIEVHNQDVEAALEQLQEKIGDMRPVLMAIGDDVVERIKGRFGSATGPDGARWRPNTQATLINYLRKRGAFSSQTGKITSRGQQLAINKRPLQGESGDLARQFFPEASSNSLTVGSSMLYAAMQHFGGTKAQFPNLFGDIPARPFFPLTATAELHPGESDLIVQRIRQYLLP